MCRIIALLTIIATIASSVIGRHFLDERMIGGENADIKDYPYTVQVMLKTIFNCGGVIIDQTHVLTSAQCVSRFAVTDLSIRAASSLLDEGGSVVDVSKVFLHPEYIQGSIHCDVAILKLETPLQFGDGVGVAVLPTQEPSPGTNVTVTGWGSKTDSPGLSIQLQVVQVPTISRSDCNKIYGLISEEMICAGLPEGGKDTCSGDIGDPLVADGIVYGVATWGRGCAQPNFPRINTNVAKILDFINSVPNNSCTLVKNFAIKIVKLIST